MIRAVSSVQYCLRNGGVHLQLKPMLFKLNLLRLILLQVQPSLGKYLMIMPTTRLMVRILILKDLFFCKWRGLPFRRWKKYCCRIWFHAEGNLTFHSRRKFNIWKDIPHCYEHSSLSCRRIWNNSSECILLSEGNSTSAIAGYLLCRRIWKTVSGQSSHRKEVQHQQL